MWAVPVAVLGVQMRQVFRSAVVTANNGSAEPAPDGTEGHAVQARHVSQLKGSALTALLQYGSMHTGDPRLHTQNYSEG